jgi:hypothetical protein
VKENIRFFIFLPLAQTFSLVAQVYNIPGDLDFF